VWEDFIALFPFPFDLNGNECASRILEIARAFGGICCDKYWGIVGFE
jgi:hypothetical protein